MCEGSLNTLVNLRGSMSFVAERGVNGEQRLTNGKDGASVEVLGIFHIVNAASNVVPP